MNAHFDMSATEDSAWGKVLCNMLYGDSDLLKLVNVHYMCPHTGGRHALVIRDSKENVAALIDLIIEAYPYRDLTALEEFKSEIEKPSSRKVYKMKGLK